AKAALRQEVSLADDFANMVGREVCTILLHHRVRVQAAVTQYVEPQIAAMLDELTRSLDAPFDPREPHA
ncbi:MAG: spermidine/putrescine ABC transporter substrate-binding protein, partial [Microbacterium chocolatum]|nr:spermidine/putrescine ABC transporter substrate-binding protein [Microbacterium chocolatum]